METMKLARLLAAGAIVVTAVSGCTTAAPVEAAPTSPTVAPPSSALTSAPQPSRVLTGTFVSQARTTRGEVVLTEEPERIVLTLTDFSTAPGGDLYIDLNPGAMTKDAAGDNVVENPSQIQLAALKSLTGTQSYDLTPMIGYLPEIQSITIYSYQSLEAFGTANLHEE